MKKLALLAFAATLILEACSGGQENQTNGDSDMKYRPLGNTGLMVSEISIGCGGFEKLDSAASLELMTMALDSGMNYIDLRLDPAGFEDIRPFARRSHPVGEGRYGQIADWRFKYFISNNYDRIREDDKQSAV